MRILDESTDKSLEKIILYLTRSEAVELRDSVTNVLDKLTNSHEHVPSNDFKKEITICLYDESDLNEFNQRSINLIRNDE